MYLYIVHYKSSMQYPTLLLTNVKCKLPFSKKMLGFVLLQRTMPIVTNTNYDLQLAVVILQIVTSLNKIVYAVNYHDLKCDFPIQLFLTKEVFTLFSFRWPDYR